MNEIKGLSSDPAEAYQQGRRDGAADALQAVELAETAHNSAMPKCLCKGWFSVRNILIQQCGTCGGVINQRTSA